MKRMKSIVSAILLIAMCAIPVAARGYNFEPVDTFGTAYLNVKTTSSAAWTEANSGGILSTDYVEINSSVGYKRNTGTSYTNAEVYGSGDTSGWAQGSIRRNGVIKSSTTFYV